nr:LytTR family DNA-binding domain-containing protein [Pseudoflavonifractor capillosus]
MSQVERLLLAGVFCRCHNSFLVNMAHIVQITRKAASLDNGTSVPVSRGYYETARSQFLHYLNTK